MSQQVRYILFIAISMVIIFGWYAIFPPAKTPPKAPIASAADAGTPADAGAPAAVTGTPSAPGPTLAAADAEPPAGPPELTIAETELWTATFTTEGGALEKFELKGDKFRTRPGDGERRPVNLAHPSSDQILPLAIEVGAADAFGPRARFKVAAHDATSLTFERTAGGVTLTKRFEWQPKSYVVQLAVTAAGAPGPLPYKLHYTHHDPNWKAPSGMFSLGARTDLHQAICHVSGKGRSLEKHVYDEEKPTQAVEGKPDYAAVDLKYFLAAIAPRETEGTSCALAAPKKGNLEAVIAGTLPSGKPATFDVFIGPKDSDTLTAAGHELKTSIDFGIFEIICRLLLTILKVFEKAVVNWGVAIVLLTLLVKAITFPLTSKQMKSMEGMRKLNPKIEELKAKYKDDQAKIQMETMKLWKEHNVSPVTGCLPMLVQMPVWFALYTTLSTAVELYNEPFIKGWIPDLTSHDPYYVTPVLMTVTMVLSQLLTPQTQQNQQMKFMMYGMPLMFGFFMLNLPAGLVLYIFTNNILSIVQSLWFRRKHGVGAAPAPAKG